MKKLIFVLALAIMLAGGGVAAMSAPADAQAYQYAPPPGDIYAAPWVGPNTPWVYYNGDWFLDGVLYYFFGPTYGWAPYYAYPHIYIVRHPEWYAPKWHAWYVARPQIYVHFYSAYPFWKGHTHSHRYDRNFYERHHRGAGAGWQEGFRGVKPERVREKPAPSRVAPPAREKPAPAPAPSRVAPPEGRKPEPPARVVPQEKGKSGPSRVAPPEERKPAPSRVAPPERQKSGPSRVAPPEGRQPAPQVAPSGGGKPVAPAPKPEKDGRGGKQEKSGPGGGGSKSGGSGGEK